MCEHKKVYSNIMLTSYPPQSPWVCEKCGETGTDILGGFPNNEYDELIKNLISS